MQKERNTAQKEIILDYLKSTTCHPSAQTIYSMAKKQLPRLSLGTVYRNLESLKQKQKIQEIVAEVSHYDGDTLPHAHFICQKCDRVIDVFEICRGCRILKKKKVKVGEINNFKIYLYGYCKNCRKK